MSEIDRGTCSRLDEDAFVSSKLDLAHLESSSNKGQSSDAGNFAYTGSIVVDVVFENS